MERGWNPGAFLPGWPIKTALATTELLPIVGTGSNGPPALADLDGDGKIEIATMSAVGSVYVFKGDGESFFSHGSCDICGTTLGGDRHEATLVPSA